MQRSKTYGIIGTIVFNGILLLLLLLFGLSVNKTEITKEDGIEVNFGGGFDGAPSEEATTEPVAAAEPIPSPPAESSPPEALTQEDPSVAIEAQKKRAEERKQKELVRQEQLRQQQIQREKDEQARKAKALADAKAAQEAKARAAAKSAFGSGNNTSGEGTSGGGETGTPGNPLGRGTAGGNSWSLAGRDLNSSFYKPSYVGNQEGRIVVSITVDKNGNVVAANIKQGTTISEENLREECKNAAKRLKFSASQTAGNAIGEIIYRFKQQ